MTAIFLEIVKTFKVVMDILPLFYPQISV